MSATRLSVRNIPFTMSEAQLRSLAVKAVKARASKEQPEITQARRGGCAACKQVLRLGA